MVVVAAVVCVWLMMLVTISIKTLSTLNLSMEYGHQHLWLDIRKLFMWKVRTKVEHSKGSRSRILVEFSRKYMNIPPPLLVGGGNLKDIQDLSLKRSA